MFGVLAASTKENGRMEKCTDSDNIVGKMGESTLDSISKTRNMAEASISGRMEDVFKVLGIWEKDKERESWFPIRAKARLEYGRMIEG